MYIGFEDISEDKLNRVRWNFWMSGCNITLDEYIEEHRDSTRKKSWEVDRIYSRLKNVNRLYQPHKCMAKEDVVVTKEIEQRVIKELLCSIEFI